MIRAADPKDPDDTDDFTLDWAAVLDTGETIASFVAAVDSGSATVDANSISGALTTARVSGGITGEAQYLRFRVTTSAGRQLDETIVIAVRAR